MSKQDDDAFKYWQNKLKSGEKPGKAAASSDEDEELDEDFSGSEVKFSEQDDDKDDEYSMNDDDFAMSSSFKQAPQSKIGASNNKAAGGASAAQQAMARIVEEEKKQDREAKLQEIMKQQKEQMKKTLGEGGDGSDSDGGDSDFDDDSEEDQKQKPKAKIGAKDGAGKKDAAAMDYFMKKAGKEVEESSEVSVTEEEDHIPVVSQPAPKSKEAAKPKAPAGGSAAQEAMARIVEEEKKQEREAKLQEIMKQQKEQMKKTLGGEGDDSGSDDSDFDDDSEGENNKKSKPAKTGAKATAASKPEKQSDAMNYFMKKAGKEVEESSEVSMSEEEENTIPVVETSQTSIGVGLVAAKPQKVQKKATEEEDDEFSDDSDQKEAKPPVQKPIVRKNKDPSPEPSEVSEEEQVDEEFEVNVIESADQSMPTAPPKPVTVQAKPAPKVAKKSPVAPIESSGGATDMVEESIADDFVEESIQDEKVQDSQSFSVHDAEEESKDKVMEMEVQQRPSLQGGNSTVNMASVVPNARIISPTSLNQQTSSADDRNNQSAAMGAPPMEVSSPMFVKAAAKADSKSGGMGGTAAADEKREKQPRFVKHANQIESKPIDIKRKQNSSSSPSPNGRQKAEEAEINEQLKQIQPRYPNQKAPIVAKSAMRPQTAKPAPATQNRVSQNNRDLTKVSVPQHNNFQKSTTGDSQSNMTMSNARASSKNMPSSNVRRPTSAVGPKNQNQTNASSGNQNQRSMVGKSATGANEETKKKENYKETSWAQPQEEKKFHKYEPKKRLPVSIVPKKEPTKQRRNQAPEVVADEANATSTSPPPARGGTTNNTTSLSPNSRARANNQDIAAIAGLGATTSTVPGVPGMLSLGSTQPGLGLGGMIPGLDIVANIKETMTKAAQRATEKVKAGSAWGSRNVPEVKKYELDAKFKPKVKEETKKAAKQKSKLATIKKEEAHIKEKNPAIPSHKVVKKPPPPQTNEEGDQENTTANKPKPPPKPTGNTVVHAGKGSVNAFDPLSALGAKSKLAMLKKQKNQQTKDTLVQQMTMSGTLPSSLQQKSTKPARPQSGVAKKKKKGGSGNQFRMPNKNRAFDNNDDLDDMFAEGEILAGDQAAPPRRVASGDDFGADDLLQGDQGMNPAIGGEDEEPMMAEEADFDSEADEEDRKFLADISGPKKPAAAKGAVAQKSTTSKQSANREKAWAGNGLGSGSLQQQKKQDDANIGRKNINMALQPAKKDKGPPKPVPWGFNPMQKDQTEINKHKEKQQQNEKDAKAKFAELQRDKKDRAANANPSLNTFMAQMNEMDNQAKKIAKKNDINPRIKATQVQEVNPAAFKKTGADRVPAEAGNVHDTESNSKMVQDLQNQLKSLFYENKQVNKQVQGIEKRKIGVQSKLENLMIEKNLIKINGKLEAKKEIQSNIKRILKSSDIPDFDKIAERANPLEPVVTKFAEKGFTPLSVFQMLDCEDEDDILTFSEIKNGLKALKIQLLDTEWQILMDAVDANGDGAVTIEEWQEILQPRLNAEREFINIMKGLNIQDPLILEEQILDCVYKKKRLEGEVKVMRSTKNREQFFRKKQVQQEQKAMVEKIKELEQQVQNSRQQNEEDKMTFDEKMRSGSLQTQADVEAEYEMLMKTKKDIEIDQGYLEEEHRKELLAQDQLFNEVNQYAIAVKRDRDRKKLELKKMTVKLELQREAEKKLDKELEAILGRAISMEDLEALYQMDLKLLGQIEAGIGNKIGSMREIIMARYVQKAWRGFVARKRTKALRAKRKEFMEKYGVFMKNTEENRRKRAVGIIARRWRQYALNKENKNKEAKKIMDKQRKEQQALHEVLSKEQLRMAEWAATVLQKNWRAYKARLEHNKSLGKSTRKFGQQLFDPFQMFVPKKKDKAQSKAIGKYNYHGERICIQCDEETATRQCLLCEDSLFCKKCFVSAHIIGTKKRHFFFDVTYDPDLPEGASTWSQPAIKIADVPERDSSFLEEGTMDSDLSSDDSLERIQLNEAYRQAQFDQAQRTVLLNPLDFNFGAQIGTSAQRSLFSRFF